MGGFSKTDFNARMEKVGKNKAWIAVDVAMAVAMPLLMAYTLMGEFAHKCIGAAAGKAAGRFAQGKGRRKEQVNA